MPLKDLPPDARPREKLLARGPGALSDQTEAVNADLHAHHLALLLGIPPLDGENLEAERVQPRASGLSHEEGQLVIGGADCDGALDEVRLLGGERSEGMAGRWDTLGGNGYFVDHDQIPSGWFVVFDAQTAAARHSAQY